MIFKNTLSGVLHWDFVSPRQVFSRTSIHLLSPSSVVSLVSPSLTNSERPRGIF